MRTHLAVIASLILSGHGVFCSDNPEQQTASSAPIQAKIVDPSSPEAAPARAAGEAAINWLGAKLLRQVSIADPEGDPKSAVASCHLKSLPTTGSPIPPLPQVTAVKLVSKRVVNPANAPDAPDKMVLDEVQLGIDLGDPPTDIIIQRLGAPDHPTEWRVYRPLAILPKCLACHGDPDEQSPELKAALAEVSAENKATGYRVGEWRGLIRVSIAPAGK